MCTVGMGCILQPLHGSVFFMLWSTAAALVLLAGKSYVSGHKPQPLSHMFQHTKKLEEMKRYKLGK